VIYPRMLNISNLCDFNRGDVFGLDGYSIPPDDLNDKSAMVRYVTVITIIHITF
jgi:hypothetical protein